MSTQVQFRRGTTTQNNAFTGANGEISVDTDVKTIRLHDGVTGGGSAIMLNTTTAQTALNKTFSTGSVWTGTAVGLAYGGTGSSLTAVPGAVPYSGASGLGLSAAGTSGQVLVSGGTGSPVWVNPSSLTTGTATTAVTAQNIAGGSAGQLIIQSDTGLSSFITAGASGTFLQSAGAGYAPTWAAGQVTIGSTSISLGATQTSLAGLNILAATGTSHWTLPVGTTAQRPASPAVGMVRYNTSQTTFEGYSAGAWSSLGGVTSVDKFTYIVAETSPTASNGDLDFYAENAGGTAAQQVGQWNRTNLKDYTGTLVGTQTTQNVFNATATTVNAFGAATTISIGAATGTLTINNANTVITGNLTVNGTTTTINSTVTSVDDIEFELGSVATPTDITANGGGIRLKGATDKTINWSSIGWTSSEDFNLVTGKQFEINGTSVLSATTLGSGVTASSLTSVGTIATGTWQGTIVAGQYGGTGVNNSGKTITLGGNLTTSGAFATTLTMTAATSVTLPTTGTLATLANSETLTNKSMSGASNTFTAIPNSALSNNTISGIALGGTLNTLTMNVSGTGLSGSTTYNGSGAATFTVTSNATNANTASTIVARDASGNFSAGTITASLSGTATTATNQSGGTVSATTGSFSGLITSSGGISGGASSHTTGSFSGAVTGASFQVSSDARLKSNIVNSSYGLSEVLQLRSVQYDKNDNHEIGLVAQEVEAVLPEFVGESDGYKTVNYGQLVSVLIKAVQELTAEVNSLKSQLNK